MVVMMVPSDSCPSDLRTISPSTTPEQDALVAENVSGTFTLDSVTISINRSSPILQKLGSGALCLQNNDCEDPDSGRCVKRLGTAKWIGPVVSTSLSAQTCTELESGRCNITIPGFEMTSVDFSTPRVAVASRCGVRFLTTRVWLSELGIASPGCTFFIVFIDVLGWNLQDAAADIWSLGETINVEQKSATVAIPATAGWGLAVCWNAKNVQPSTAEAVEKASFNLQLTTITFPPFPVITGRHRLVFR